MIPTWSDLIGNPQLKRWFGSALTNHRFGGSFLFVGPPGIGKRSVAALLARTLLCNRNAPEAMEPCGRCEACAQVNAETHPDVIRVRKPEGKSTIPLELLIGAPEVRMQEGFCRDVRLSPYYGDRKIAILEDADFLNEEGANCLLKTLEEPPADAVIILIGTSEQKQLPTIRSRCQIIRFSPPDESQAIRLLRDVHRVDADEDQIKRALSVSAGDIHVALRMLDEPTRRFRDALFAALAGEPPDPIAIRRIVTTRVDEAGKEAAKKREVLRDVFSVAVQHYRNAMRREAFSGSPQAITLARLDRSVRALRELDRMANVSTLIDCYAADIAIGQTGDRGEIGS